MKHLLNLFCVLSLSSFGCLGERTPATNDITGVKTDHEDMPSEQDKDKAHESILTKYVRLPVDHFDRKNKKKWYLKYYQNLEFWEPKSPIYIYVGGNAPLVPNLLMEGLMYDLANETGGVMFAAEHRFYGEKNTIKDLTFLTSEQALLDLESLLDEIKEVPAYRDSKVVLVGGGYGGSLAVWLKATYPSAVDAVIASGAPLLAKADFHEYYFYVATNYLLFMSRPCSEQLLEMYQTYYFCIRDSNTVDCIKRRGINLPVCSDVDMQLKANQHLFLLSELSYLAEVAEQGYKPMRKVCEMLKFHSRRGSGLFWQKKRQCFDYDYGHFLEFIKEKANEPARHWMYQCCNEFGFFQTTTTIREPFNTFVPLDSFYRNCNNLFGPQFDKFKINEGINRTNKRYGGLKPNVTNVIFVQGELDPWKHLGVLGETINTNDVIIIPGASHCRDLLPKHDTDSESLVKARRKIKILVKYMLGLENTK